MSTVNINKPTIVVQAGSPTGVVVPSNNQPLQLQFGSPGTQTYFTGSQQQLDLTGGTTRVPQTGISLVESTNNLEAQLNTGSSGDASIVNPTQAVDADTGQVIQDAGTATKSEGGESQTGGEPSEGEGPPMKPCPDCGAPQGIPNAGKMSVNKKKKPVNDTNSWFPSQPFAGLNFLQIAALVLESIGSFLGNLVDIFDVKEGKCETCGGKREVEDKSDQKPEIQKTVAAANAQKEKLTELESKASGGTGLGGNDIKLIVGNKFLKVGMAYNDFQSYESVPEGKDVPAGVDMHPQGPTKVSRKIAQVNGLNPLPTIGGNYTMEIGNHFKVRTGAQGIELSTEGPFIVKAGQTQFIGPEVAIGTATGETRISGNHLQLDGESIALTPGRNGRGQVITQGTHTVTGNMVAQGGAHIEGDLSFISATCPFKEDRTKHSSQEAEYCGPARWSAFAAVQGARDFLRTLTIRTLDPSMIILSPRQILNLLMDAKELGEKALPLELLPTGLIFGVMPGPAILPIWNFPHHHTLTDQIHAHNMRVPNINMLEDAEQVRGPAGAKVLRAPVPANKESALLKLFKIISIPYQLIVAAIQRIF